MSSTPDVQVTNNKAAQRYEVSLPAGAAFVAYRPDGNALIFRHTEVPEPLQGQGLGSALVKGALDDAREQGLKVIPKCRFVLAYLKRHPEYADLVAE